MNPQIIASAKICQSSVSAAIHLIDIPGVERASDLVELDYVHFACDDHQIVYAEGTPTESLYIGDMALDVLGSEACAELELIFPDLSMPVSDRIMTPARMFLTGRQSRKLSERLNKNNYTLLGQDHKADLVPC